MIPDPPQAEVAAEVSDHEVVIPLGDRRYRIRGLARNTSLDALKVNLLVSRPAFDGPGEALHVDAFDLYHQRPRHTFARQAAAELGVKEETIRRDLGRILLRLEALQAERLAAAAEAPGPAPLADAEREAALALLRDPDLLGRIARDLTRCGVVGEETNKLVATLAVLSRKLEAPLAVTIQSTSAAGKSSLMEAVLGFVPPEERIQYSALTGQSLFYMGERDLAHKVLAIAEEEGAHHAAYALKLLQSEGELTIASTGKDPATGELRTLDYRVKGPVMILLTTTAIDVDEELLNRCLVLTVDEGRAQTRAIHALQRDRRTLRGLLAKAERQGLQALHQNAQRLLEPLAVVNPYAAELTFACDRTRTRRDHEKYLTLIDTLALLHQHQRPVKTAHHEGRALRYVEVTPEDIATANRLAHEVLGRTLDELPPKTRELLGRLHAWVEARCAALETSRAEFRFSRRDVREALAWSDTALKVHLGRLVEMEYLLVHRGGRGQRFVYELLYQGEGTEGQPFVMGLRDVATLGEGHGYDASRSGPDGDRSGAGQAPVSPRSGGGRGAGNGESPRRDAHLRAVAPEEREKALLRRPDAAPSYRTHTAAGD